MRALIILTVLTILNSCSTRDKSYLLNNAFENWKQEQIANGQFLSSNDCRPDFVISNDSIQDFGFPEEIEFHYADINSDDQLDALITFIPQQCDGGNGSMWTQFQLLILSNGSGYLINDRFFDNVGKKLDGFYHLDSALANEFQGTYYEFKEGDGRCCPSTNTRMTIKFDTKELKILN